VILVARGGGARTDLVAFDTEAVARAIASCPVPVLTGIGHEIDRTVADAVAHRAFKTPTAAAAWLARRGEVAVEHLHGIATRLTVVVPGRLDRQEDRLAVRLDRVERAAVRRLERAETELGGSMAAVVTRATRSSERVRQRLDALESRVRALDPGRALARGWSVTRTLDGALVRDPSLVPAGTMIETQLAGGRLQSRVEAPETERLATKRGAA